MRNKFDSLVKQEKRTLEHLKVQADRSFGQMIRSLGKFLGDWYDKKSREYIRDKYEVTDNLAYNRIKEMKDKVQALKNKAKDIAEKYLSDKRIWSVFDSERESFESSPIDIKIIIRFALCEIVPILREFGYFSPLEIENWIKKDGREEHMYYSGPLSLPESTQTAIGNFSKVYSKAVEVSKNINNLLEEKRKEKAEKRWDEV